MLKINIDPEFTADVNITIPGKVEPGTMTCTFRYKNREQLKQFSDSQDGKEEFEIIKEVLVSWNGIDAEFNDDNLKTFLTNYPAGGFDIIMGYQKLVLESRVKN